MGWSVANCRDPRVRQQLMGERVFGLRWMARARIDVVNDISTDRIPVRVERVAVIATDICRFDLRRIDGEPLPNWRAGAHIDVHIAPGLVRQYSLCGDANGSECYSIAVKREESSRGGSAALHANIRAGADLEISRPRNLFPLEVGGKERVLLVAAGIGITPIITMARELARSGRRFALLYFVRNRDACAFREEISSLPLRESAEILHENTPERVRAILEARLNGSVGYDRIYTCGPGGFMSCVREVAVGSGIKEDFVRSESFGAIARKEEAPSKAFHLRLARAGVDLCVPEGSTAVDVLRAAGISIETSCEQGVCGTCVTKVLEGVPDHRDSFLTDAEKRRNDCIALCVSRACSEKLVIDL